MKYRQLADTGVFVSELCLGTMTFGGRGQIWEMIGGLDQPAVDAIVHGALDAGINVIDTANVYSGGESETMTGKALAGRRQDVVLATKVRGRMGKGPNDVGLSRSHILEAVDASLKRLGTDYLDILYFHRAIPDLPLEEAVRAVGDLIRQGKACYFGVSNFSGWRIAEVVRICDQMGIDRPVASEPLYNLVDRTAEVEQLPAAGHYGLGVVSYSPLARGVLTGKYAADAPPPADTRAGRGDKRMQQTEWRPESLRVAQAIARHAQQRGTTSVAFALAWVLNNPLVSATIAGPRTEAQWDSYRPALALELGPEDEKLVDNLVPPGHASTPGYTDPGYPVEGRRT
jgi:aryl-alcohol dehydrogenase-like predicted oxidoreductase